MLPNLPEGYMYDHELYPCADWNKYDIKKTIRKNFDEKDLNKLSKELYLNAIAVLCWAENLPDLNVE